MLTRSVNVLKTTGPLRLLWLSVLFSELSSAVITSLMSIILQGRVTRDYLITSGVVALAVSFVLAFILISLLDAVRKAEKKAGEERAAIGNLLENSAVATFVIKPDHTVVFWNKACEALTGYPAASQIGKSDHWKPFYAVRRQTLADVVLDGIIEVLPQLYEQHRGSTLLKHGLHAEGWYANMNGKDRYLIFDAAPVYDDSGQLTGVIETLQDITPQKQMEEALALSEGRLRAVIDTEPECVKLVSRDGTIQEMNPAGLAMLEADTPQQVVGQPMLPHIVQEHHSGAQALLKTVFQGGSGTLEFEIVGKRGTHRWLETHAAPLRNARGDIYAMLGVTRDVTERREWERKLEEQLQFLQVLIDTIPMPVFYKDAQGVYQVCNTAFAAFLGQAKANIIGKSVYDLAPKELADRYYARDRELLENPGIQIYESPVKHADGTHHDVIFNKAAYTDGAGAIAGLLGVMQDITERKTAEQTIQRNYDTQTAINWILNISLKSISLERVLKEALDVILSIPWLSFESRGSIFLVDKDTQTLVMTAQRGLSEQIRDQCRILPFGKCLCGRAAARGEVQFADALDARHEGSYEGSDRHGHYCVPMQYERKIIGVINIYLDEGHQQAQHEIDFLSAIASALAGIIQRKRIEEERSGLMLAISRSQKEWQDTFDSIADLIFIVSKDFRILKANRAFSAYLGLQPPAVINRKCLDLVHETGSQVPNGTQPTDREEGKAEPQELFDKLTGRMFRISTYPYASPDGAVLGSIHVARDITEEKEKETRLIMSERLASLGQMASGIAHEINNPLAAIAGCAEGLLGRVRQERYDAAFFANYLAIIQEEIVRCKTITTGMLSYVRKSSPVQKDVDIQAILDHALEIFAIQGRLREVEVVRTPWPEKLIVRGNDGELKQAFLSIITNALDAMEDRGILTIRTENDGSSLSVRISDTGSGIAQEFINKIFEPFFSTKTDKGGTGLGLAIANKIVSNHGGRIDVVSEQGSGTTFTLMLPLRDQAMAAE